MAHYSFICESCGREYEVRCTYEESAAATCPDCAGVEKRRLYKPTAFAIKETACRHQDVCPSAGGGCCGGACH